MAYNLYQVQMAQSWKERVNKENAMAEKFWMEHAARLAGQLPDVGGRTWAGHPAADAPGSQLAAHDRKSLASMGGSLRSVNTDVLRSKLEMLESELATERQRRIKIEGDLAAIKGTA